MNYYQSKIIFLYKITNVHEICRKITSATTVFNPKSHSGFAACYGLKPKNYLFNYNMKF